MLRKMLVGPAVLVALLVTSCGAKSGFESDVRTMAKHRCELQKLMTKEGEAAEAEIEKKQQEMEAFAEEMEKKYKDKEGDKEMEEQAEKIMKDEMMKCK